MPLLTTEALTWFASLDLGKIDKIQPFLNARTNHVFFITTENGQQLVFKCLNLKARNSVIRKSELAIQSLASRRGLSATVIADCQHYRVQTFIEGKILNCAVQTAATVQLFASQLQIIHQLPAKYALPQSLASELQFLHKQATQGIAQHEFTHFLQLATHLDKSSKKETLCHGDLSFNNLIKTETGAIKILDWEYAVLACPAYDLASCCAINRFTKQQSKQLIAHYYLLNKEQLPLSLTQLEKQCAQYLSVFTYLNKLWAQCF